MKKRLLIFAFVLIGTGIKAQQPQQKIWYLDNQYIDFRGATPVLVNGLPGNQHLSNVPYGASRNGVHDQNGGLLFYVADNQVINNNGNVLGQLNFVGVQSRSEMDIVSVPSISCQYYIITQSVSMGSPCGGERYNLGYSVIDLSLNNGQGGIISTGNVLNSCNYVTGSAITVGKIKANNTHFLYQVGVNGGNNLEITRYTIGSAGTIGSPALIFSSNSQGIFSPPVEMELSFDNDKLAFATDNKLFILHLDANGNVNTTLGNQGNGLSKFTIGTEILTGVEFSTNGNNLFVGQRNTGIHVVNPSTGSSTPLTGLNIETYGNSQLETAYSSSGNNEIYVVGLDAGSFVLGKITNPNGVSPSFSPAVLSGYNPIQDPTTGTAPYQLPDQIDGFDYSSIGIGGPLDLYSKDTYNDFGVEPNIDNGPLWISEDIWVRMNNDGIQYQQTESIEYRTGEQVFVYVRVRNRSCQSSSETETLTLNWAKASTGLSWPTDWNGSVVVGGQPYSGLIGNLPIPLIDAGNETILTFTWTPPNPDVFQAAFGTDYKHFCLLSRIQTSSTAPYGMTYPEGSNIYANTKNNNNIVWKNVQINNDIPGIVSPGGTGVGNGAVIVRNVETIPVKIKLGFKVPVEELGNSIFDKGTIKVNLGTDLFDKWNAGGRVGNGVALAYELRSPRELDPIIGGIDISTPVLVPILTITNPNAYIGNITLAGREEHTISMEFYQDIALPAEGKNQFNYDVVQYNTNGTEEITGGERYIINALVEQTVYGTTLRKGNTTEQLTSIEDLSGNKIAIYPNPTSGEFTINLKNAPTQEANFTLTTLDGKIIKQEKVNNTTVVMDLSDYPKGIYVLKMENAQLVNVYKVIKQ